MIDGVTYPKGAIPDHVTPNGKIAWGYGAAPCPRPSMDEAMCFILLGWHYGYKAQWDHAWQSWFRQKAPRFADAWHSVPRNPKTGLVTQWTTPGHIGANGITETYASCVMWGFHDSYGFPGDDVGTSVLACNAARALADMCDHAADPAAARRWSVLADAMRDAVRAQFHAAGYLPWGVGKGAPTMASPDITGYAVWSGILTDAQADAASDWFAARYRADKAQGGAADLFMMQAGLHGAVRMARRADDVSPGLHVWPHVPAGHWENLGCGYNAYQDGGYWYYMSLGIAATLWRRHPTEAREWTADTYTDITRADVNHPYERLDNMTVSAWHFRLDTLRHLPPLKHLDNIRPVNLRYNASVAAILGIGLPAEESAMLVHVR